MVYSALFPCALNAALPPFHHRHCGRQAAADITNRHVTSPERVLVLGEIAKLPQERFHFPVSLLTCQTRLFVAAENSRFTKAKNAQ